MKFCTKHFSALVAFVIVSTAIFAQSPPLVPVVSNSFGGSDKEEFFGGCSVRSGGYLLSGLSYSKDGDIDPANAYDSADAFIVRVDDAGNILWSKSMGGDDYDKARFCMEDRDSNLVITGGTYSVNGDITSNYGGSELFVIKLDKNGNKIWFRNYGGTDLESGRFVSENTDGSYMIAGYSTSEDFDVPTHRGWHDGWIMKLDTAGNILWSQTYGGGKDDRIRCLTPMPDGGFIFAGSSKSNNMQNLGNHGLYDFWVGRIDSSGNLLWSKQFGGTQDDIAMQVSPGPPGSVLVTGYTSSPDGDVTGFYGNSDGWVICVDTSGTLVWQKCLGGSGYDRLYRSFLSSSGKIYSGGYSDSDDFDLTNANSGYFAQYWLLSMDQNQALDWSYLTGGSFGDYGNELLVNEQDSTFTMMGDSKSTNMAVSGNHGEFDFWLVKLSWSASSGISETGSIFEMYFNQSSSALHFSLPTAANMQMMVTDLTGRTIALRNLQTTEGANKIHVPELQHAAAGLYTVTLTSEKFTRSLKVPVSAGR